MEVTSVASPVLVQRNDYFSFLFPIEICVLFLNIFLKGKVDHWLEVSS